MPDCRVPQKDGQITIRQPHWAGGTKTWNVSDHVVKVAEDNLDLFLSRVEGSSVVGKTPASEKE